MNRSEIFRKAHSTARSIRAQYENYRSALSAALKMAYRMTTEQTLVKAGLSVWEKGEHRRIYINGFRDLCCAFPDLFVGQYKTGNVSSASYKGEKISNGRAHKLIGYGMHFDCNSSKWVNVTTTAANVLEILPADIR